MPRSQKSQPVPTPRVPVPVPARPLLPSVPTIPQPAFIDSIKTGFTFGVGNALAQRLVSNAFGLSNQPETEKEICSKERIVFQECMKTKSDDGFCGMEQMAYSQCLKMSK
jgi:hypothetical protein